MEDLQEKLLPEDSPEGQDPLDEAANEAGWFDDADAELDRLMQEDALIDALQHEAEGEGFCQDQEREVIMQPFEVENPGSKAVSSSASAWDTGSLASTVESISATVNESLGLHSRDSAKDRSINDTVVGSEGTRLLRHPEASGSPAGVGSLGARLLPGRQPQKPKPIPWGALALFVVAIFSIVYLCLGLFESPVERDSVSMAKTAIAAAKYAEPKPIGLPAADRQEVDLLRPPVNASFGVNRGRIAVQKSKEIVGGSEGHASSNASSSSEEAPSRGDRSRRNRLRSQGDAEGDLR